MCSIALGTTQITTCSAQNLTGAAMVYARPPSMTFVHETENQLKNQLKQTSAPQHDLGEAARNCFGVKYHVNTHAYRCASPRGNARCRS